MEYLPWPGSPIPGNASATGKYRLPNGIYALHHGDGQLRFVCRVVAGQVTHWLNLGADGQSGHFDEGNSGEAYYKNGRMETFSPWDDSDPFPAKEPFENWRARVLGLVTQPVPADAPESQDLELKDLRASCARNFGDPPGTLTADDWRMRFLGFFRRCHFNLHGFADGLSDWVETVRLRAAIPVAWQTLMIEELPLTTVAQPGLWQPDWQGTFSWQSRGSSWLLDTVAAFAPPVDELGSLRKLASFPGPGPSQPICRLRALIFAGELLERLGEAETGSALPLAKGLHPDWQFQAELGPWREHPEELEYWQLDWETLPKLQPPTYRQKHQLATILERLGVPS